MGHHGSMMDASWAEDPQKRIDFAWRANHLTAVLAKAVMQTLYRQPPAAKVCLLYGLLRRRSRSIDGSAALSAGF
ncbi:hydrolase [Klebsiella pneumoniae]|nr:hydrolase [Klebsiella pneumoniae]STU36947.1 hydrolase [Klebsiella pneumoniae]